MSTPHTRTIELNADDAFTLGAYVSAPAGTPKGAVVVIQEIFGVNSHIRDVADRFAREGWLAVAPALFDRVERGVELGYADVDMKRGRELAGRLDMEKVLLDVKAALAHVSTAGRVGIVGYCFGGKVSWMAASRLEGLAAAVTYYGGGMQQRADLEPRCPVLAHFGEQDTHIPVDDVKAFLDARPEVEGHFYDAQHGFNCDQRPSYDAQAAQLAAQRTYAFFHRHLG